MTSPSILALLCLLFSVVDLSSGNDQQNVLDTALELCSRDPLTGWYRDGFCRTDEHDHGIHTVCAEMTREFLEFTAAQGNDLSTARGGFPGLNPGDHWCLCAARWEEAHRAGKAPKVKLSATNRNALRRTTLENLRQHDNTQACSNGTFLDR